MEGQELDLHANLEQLKFWKKYMKPSFLRL